MSKLVRFLLCLSMCIPLFMAQFEERENVCGFRKISRTPKIINGKEAFHGQFPWAISLRLHRRHHCGGALINHNWVLTAAHCVAQIGHRAFSVKLGGHYRSPDHEPNSVELPVSKVLAHEGFSFTSFANDIALIKLAKSVDYNNYVGPICLPQIDSADFINQTGVVIGWGKLTPNGVSATTLQQVELPIIDNTKCIKWYESQGKLIPIRPSQFCAGLEEGGKDACQGDSGSPMMKLDPHTGQAMAIGIVSAGIGCALPKLPGLYTRISAYIPWVKKTIIEASLPEEKPSEQTTKPTTHMPRPVVHTEKPTVHITKPTVPTSKPMVHTTKPTSHTTKPIVHTEKPTVHPAKPTVPTVKPAEPTKVFNSSIPIYTIPPYNTSVINIHFPPWNQTHHNHQKHTLIPSTSTTSTTTTTTTTTAPVSTSKVESTSATTVNQTSTE